MLAERLEHVDTRNEEIVALELIAKRCPQRIECAAHPLFFRLGLLIDDAQFSVKKPNALINGQNVTGNGVVTRADKRGLAARDLQPRDLDIRMPTAALFLDGKYNGIYSRLPAILYLHVENIAPAEPSFIQVVVHLVAQPRGREDLGTALGAQRLPFSFLLDAGLDDVSVDLGDSANGDLIVAHITVAQADVLVVRPDDIATRRPVAK